MGGCRFSVGLRRLLRGGLQGSAGTCQYLQMAAGTPRGSALRGSLVTPPGSAGLCGGPPVLTGTYEWPQVLRGAPWVLWGLLRAPQGSSGLHRYSAGVRGDPQILTGTCRWLQVLRGVPWVLWGLLGAPRVLHIGPQGSRGTPQGSAYKLDTPLTNDLHVYRDQSF